MNFDLDQLPEVDSLRIGVLRLGRMGGKSKYSLIDERDVSIVQQYNIRARMEADENGTGGYIYVALSKIGGDKNHERYIQDILWEHHRGGIAPGWHVVHKNRITVDNRLDNLELVSKSEKRARHFSQLEEEKLDSASHSKMNRENSLYWCMITQLLSNPAEVNHYYGPSTRWMNPHSNPPQIPEAYVLYYECHFPPCTRMERTVREFSICGNCQRVRYCGPVCQERDWHYHKKWCGNSRDMNECVPRRYLREPSPVPQR